MRAWVAHPDPAAALANLLALMIAANGPFYPLWAMLAIGRAEPDLALTLFATQFFAAVPILMREHPGLGRLALPVLGTANTMWCLKLLGPASGVGLFLLPCLVLAALLFRRTERPLLIAGIAVPFAGFLVPDAMLGPPVMSLGPAEVASLARLDLASVAMLLALLGWQLAGLMARLQASGIPPSALSSARE